MEAARYRKALLARRLPVLEELLGRTQAASLIGRPTGPGNRIEVSADELGSEMIRLLANPEAREQMGQNAYRVSQRFLWGEVAGRFERAYCNALGRSLDTETHCGAVL
jgi:glycosyltransferase involved in cell wall biosynthesis